MLTKEEIRVFFTANPSRLFKMSEIQRALNLDRTSRHALRKILRELEEEGKIHRFKSRRYGLLQSSELITGTISIARKGFGFLRPETDTPDATPLPDVFIKSRNLGGALPGDRVLVHLTTRDSERPEGRVTKILKRACTEIVGRFHFERKGGTVIPRDTRIGRIINVPKLDFRNELRNGIWVMVRILDYGDNRTPMLGEITDVIGKDEDKGIDILLVIRDYGVKPEFPDAVMEEAATFPASISDEEIAKRKDFRHLATFTIDPATAKDFDDALSIERLEDGGFRLGVHIADVSHYVQPETALDSEARLRATSIYPVDRVIPMLPERLSNDLCSLRPDVDRLAMSVVMDIDSTGKVHNCRMYNAIIRSRFRLNYEEVQTVFDHSDPWVCAKYASVRDDLFALKEVSELLMAMRQRRGALDLDVGETEVVFDSAGAVIDLRRHPRLASHRLVEQCMLIANEVVARRIFRLHLPSIYRIHEPPSQDKLHKLAPVLANFGINIPPKRNITPRGLQHALDRTEELGDVGPILRRVILRAMMRAQYSHENKGHYGLASRCYTHFTSPIRRYPDLIVHRILKGVLSGEYHETAWADEWSEILPEWAVHCSDQERRADDIENEATYIKGLEFMQQFIGEEFEGVISGITGFGIFIELKRYPIEGLVPIASIGNDYYVFEESTMTLVGKKSGRTFRLGDKVTIAIEQIDIINQEMDLALIR